MTYEQNASEVNGNAMWPKSPTFNLCPSYLDLLIN